MDEHHPTKADKHCADCIAQTRKGPMDRPHVGLLPIAIRSVGPAGDEWIEAMYLCDVCGARLQRRGPASEEETEYWVFI